MPFAMKVAAVNHTWYRTVLPIVERTPWVCSWRAVRAMLANITVQVFESSLAAATKEELPRPHIGSNL